jgi:hypothetical protein
MTDQTNGATYAVGYKRPPEHSRFQPGRSGNPSGRPKDSKNFKTLLRQILNEQISLQDGVNSRKVSKREAITRRLIIGAMKGDSRDLHALFKLAEQTGEFDDARNSDNLEVVVRWMSDAPLPAEKRFPVISQLNRE